MTSTQALILFTRPQCHLCDVAADVLDGTELNWSAVNIETEPALEAQYGLRVPVIRDPASGRELDYPFGVEDLERFLAQ